MGMKVILLCLQACILQLCLPVNADVLIKLREEQVNDKEKKNEISRRARFCVLMRGEKGLKK